jgi:AraC-like DNA-binding protein
MIDWLSTLIFIGSAQGLLITLSLVKRSSEKGGTHRWLSGLCLFASATLIDGAFEISGFFRQLPFLIGVVWPLNLLFAPLIYGYVLHMCGRVPGRPFSLHYIPAIISLTLLIPFYLMGSDEKTAYFFEEANSPPIYTWVMGPGLLFTVYMSILQPPCYLIASIRSLKRYKAKLTSEYSYSEKISLSWLYYLVLGFVAVWGVFSFDSLYGDVYSLGFILSGATHVLLAVLIYIMSFFALGQDAIFRQLNICPTEAVAKTQTKADHIDKYTRSPEVDDDLLISLSQSVLTYMQQEKPHLISGLSLPILAAKVQISTHLLSQLINQQMGQNFFDFINGYRIAEAKRLIEKAPSSTALDLAMKSGFNSKSTFYTAFKKHTQLTPSAFKQSLFPVSTSFE